MGKVLVEVCLISARGLRRSSPSILKQQWYAVAWIDPNNKYCTTFDASKSDSPVWRTKFSTLLEDSDFQDAALHVEVYSREPLFLRERLHGSATIVLKESLAKYRESTQGADEVGSYQLRKKNLNKPHGFIDLSIRVSGERAEPNSYFDNDPSSKISLSSESSSGQIHLSGPTHQAFPPFQRPQSQPNMNSPSTEHFPYATNYHNPSLGAPSYAPHAGPSYQPPRNPTPRPPPPPSNVGYIPTFIPRPEAHYVNMPSSGPAGAGRGMDPRFGVGLGAGALAAGAVIFGDDFMSGSDFPASLPNINISVDPPF